MIRRMSRGARTVLTLAVVLGFAIALYGVAQAAAITNVVVEKYSGKAVKVEVRTDGPVQWKVTHLPPGTYDYRTVALDVWPAYIVGGKEPKSVLPVNEGLVAQVRVRQISPGVVRIYTDVIFWPKYEVYHQGGVVGLLFQAYKQAETKKK